MVDNHNKVQSHEYEYQQYINLFYVLKSIMELISQHLQFKYYIRKMVIIHIFKFQNDSDSDIN